LTRAIAILGLGGTIAMEAGPNGLQPSLSASQLLATLGPGRRDLSILTEDIRAVASANITLADLAVVSSRAAALAEQGRQGLVIVQGTDTLEETAFALELLVGPGLPLVCTGAMRGASQLGSDGAANIAAAIEVAATASGDSGAMVVLNGEVHAARYVRKAHTTALNAFSSGGAPLLGLIHEGAFRPAHVQLPSLGRHPAPAGRAWPRVALLTVGLGPEPELFEQLPQLGFAGCVIEAMGAGHVPERLLPAIDALIAEMPVVLCSRAAFGPVCERTYGYRGSETDLLARGVLSGGALSSLKARIALAVCLATYGSGAAEAFKRIVSLV
jgi:L-asparaginase